jgi:hypothetical protein
MVPVYGIDEFITDHGSMDQQYFDYTPGSAHLESFDILANKVDH